MSPKKDKAKKPSAKPGIVDSPDDGGFGVQGKKIKATKKAPSSDPAMQEVLRKHSASVGDHPVGPKITNPNHWAHRVDPPSQTTDGRDKPYQSMSGTGNKRTTKAGFTNGGGKTATTPGSRNSASVASGGIEEEDEDWNVPQSQKEGNKGSAQATPPVATSVSGSSKQSSTTVTSPPTTVAVLNDSEYDLPEDFNVRPQPQRARAPAADENNDNFQASHKDSLDEDYNLQQGTGRRGDLEDSEVEYQATIYSSTGSSMTATQMDARLGEDIEQKIRAATEKWPSAVPIGNSINKRIQEAEAKFLEKVTTPSSRPAIPSDVNIARRKEEPEASLDSSRSTQAASQSVLDVSNSKAETKSRMENTMSAKPISREGSGKHPENPLLPLLRELLEDQFLSPGMAGAMIRTGLEHRVYAQLDDQSHNMKTYYTGKQLQAILDKLANVNIHELEELAEQVMSQFGNLLTVQPVTPDQFNNDFAQFENDLTEEYDTAANEGIMSGIPGRTTESMRKSSSGGASRPARGTTNEERSVALMVENMASIYTEAAESSHHGVSHHGTSDHGASHHGASHHEASQQGASDHVASHHGVSHHEASQQGASDHVASHHGASHHGASHHEALQQRASDHVASHHGVSHHEASQQGASDHGASDHRAQHDEPHHSPRIMLFLLNQDRPRTYYCDRCNAYHRVQPRYPYYPRDQALAMGAAGVGFPRREERIRDEEPRWDAHARYNPMVVPEPAPTPPRAPEAQRMTRAADRGRAGAQAADPGRAGARATGPRRAAAQAAPEPQGAATAATRGQGGGRQALAASPQPRHPATRAPRESPPRHYDPGLAALFRMAPAFTREEWRDVERNPFEYLAGLDRRGLPGRWMESAYFTGANYEALWNLAGRMRPQGLPAAQVGKLKRVKFNIMHTVGGTKEEKECAICLLEFTSGETLMQLPCKHLFHESCITEWIQRRATCPVCRFDLQGRRP